MRSLTSLLALPHCASAGGRTGQQGGGEDGRGKGGGGESGGGKGGWELKDAAEWGGEGR